MCYFEMSFMCFTRLSKGVWHKKWLNTSGVMGGNTTLKREPETRKVNYSLVSHNKKED